MSPSNGYSHCLALHSFSLKQFSLVMSPSPNDSGVFLFFATAHLAFLSWNSKDFLIEIKISIWYN